MLLSTAILVGFLGSVHCLGMCAPITWAIPDDRSKRWTWLGKKLVYNFGRIVTYSVFGAIVGLFGQMLSIAGVQQGLSIVAGVVLMSGVLLFRGKFPEIPLFKPFRSLLLWAKVKMSKLLLKKGWKANFGLGMINGLLPCGLVYAALIAAISMGDIVGGAAYMALFGLGTLPMMIAAAGFGRIVGQRMKWKLLKLTPKFIFVLGLIFVLRGLNLGIPYLSPELTNNIDFTECAVNFGTDEFSVLR